MKQFQPRRPRPKQTWPNVNRLLHHTHIALKVKRKGRIGTGEAIRYGTRASGERAYWAQAVYTFRALYQSRYIRWITYFLPSPTNHSCSHLFTLVHFLGKYYRRATDALVSTLTDTVQQMLFIFVIGAATRTIHDTGHTSLLFICTL